MTVCKPFGLRGRASQKTRCFSIVLSVLISVSISGCLSPLKRESPAPLERRPDSSQTTSANPLTDAGRAFKTESATDKSSSVRNVREVRPAMVLALSDKADDATSDGDWDRAQAALERAIKVAPKDYALWLRLAYSHYRQGNNELALTVASRALNFAEDVGGNVGLVWDLIGDIEAARGNHKAAVFAKSQARAKK